MADLRVASAGRGSTTPRDKIKRCLGGMIGVSRGDVVRVAGEDQQFGIGYLLLPRARFLDRAKPALLGRNDQSRARDLRQISRYIGAGDGPHKSQLSRHRGATHEFGPPFDTFWREIAA